MVRAWLYNTDDSSDQRNFHYKQPNQPVTIPQLKSLGVHYWHVADTAAARADPTGGALGAIRSARSYKNHDVINVNPVSLPNYENKIKMFFEEHLHEDEEIRYLLAGSGFFDIRDELDVTHVGGSQSATGWIRVHLFEGDMIVLPAGAYHRFTLDNNNKTEAMRLFKDAPKWEALNRNAPVADKTAARAEYLSFIDAQRPLTAALQQQQQQQQQQQPVAIHSNSNNGTSYTLAAAAGGLANYPHMRACNGLLYVSGLSSRLPNGRHRGVTYADEDDSSNSSNSSSSSKTTAPVAIAFDAQEQTAAVLENIESILAAAGADLTHVLTAYCTLSDMQHYAAFNRGWNQYFSDAAAAPVRMTVAVKQLPHVNLVIEIQVTARDPRYELREIPVLKQ